MIDRIDKDKFNELRIVKSTGLEDLAKQTDTPSKYLDVCRIPSTSKAESLS